MQDPGLCEATGSEPLTMEEELQMQKSWRDDPNKCTFIVLAREQCEIDATKREVVVSDCLHAMVGDVNLFLSEIDDDDDEAGERGSAQRTENDHTSRIQAEIDIMIAEQKFQRMGIGRAATCSMLIYGATTLNIHRFFCKINEDNKASIQLFENLGFVQCNYAACFKQVEFELIKPLPELQKILEPFGGYTILDCPLEDPKY